MVAMDRAHCAGARSMRRGDRTPRNVSAGSAGTDHQPTAYLARTLATCRCAAFPVTPHGGCMAIEDALELANQLGALILATRNPVLLPVY